MDLIISPINSQNSTHQPKVLYLHSFPFLTYLPTLACYSVLIDGQITHILETGNNFVR